MTRSSSSLVVCHSNSDSRSSPAQVLRHVRMSFTSGLLDFPFAQDRPSCLFVHLASQHGVAAATLRLGPYLDITHSITHVFLLTPTSEPRVPHFTPHSFSSA